MLTGLLKRLLNRRGKILSVINKMVTNLEQNNEQLYELKLKAYAKAEKFNAMVIDADKQMKDNSKTINKFHELLK
jgi:hypothetical protein